MNLERQPFTPSEIPEIFRFIDAHAIAPFFSKAIITRFTSELISSPKQIIDVFRNQERVAFAVLLDKITNRTQTASLEVLAMKPEGAKETYQFIVSAAESELGQNFLGFTLGHNETSPFQEESILKNGAEFLYEIVEMNLVQTLSSVLESKNFIALGNSRFESVTDTNFKIYRSLLLQVFQDNLEINFPDEEESRKNIIARKIPIYLFFENETPVGFVNVLFDEEKRSGMVNTIGLKKSARGKGYGKLLLHRALEILKAQNPLEVTLTAETSNEHAIKLYEAFGFRINARFKTFRKLL